MDLRSVGRRYGDLLIAAILAVLLTVEVLLWPRADHALPVAAALLATLPLALRRRLLWWPCCSSLSASRH